MKKLMIILKVRTQSHINLQKYALYSAWLFPQAHRLSFLLQVFIGD